MKNDYVLKSGIDLNNEENITKINDYFEKLESVFENPQKLMKFSKIQVSMKKDFISYPIELNDVTQKCKDMAFLYKNDEIIGHIYSDISNRRICYPDREPVVIKNIPSINPYDYYIPEYIEIINLIVEYMYLRVENVFELNYSHVKEYLPGVKVYEKKF